MKKKFLQTCEQWLPASLSFAVLSLLIFPRLAFAQLQNPLSSISTLPEFITALLDIVVFVGIPIIVLFIIYAGFLFVTARGDATQLTRARNTFVWVLIGAGIILAAKIIADAIAATIDELR